MQKRLYRSKNKIIAGVCAGIADYLGWDTGLVRLIYLIITFFSAAFPGVIVYLLFWMIIPEESY